MATLLSSQLLFAALVLGSLYALIALGLNLVYGTMRLLNVAHGEFVMIGAYVAYFVSRETGLGTVWALVPAMLLCGALGLLLHEVLFRRMLGREGMQERIEANSLLIFFGLSIILQNVASLLFTANPRSYSWLDGIVHVAGASLTANRIFAFGVAAGACMLCMAFFAFSTTGLAIRALLQNRTAAALVGIPAERINRTAFMLGFAMAGLAGALLSMNQAVSPFIGFPFTISAFVVIILGGLGNLVGSLVGGLILAFIEVYGVALTSSNWQSILTYGVFIAMLLWRPQGLFGTRRTA
jgi:branched-chain amino acid transport system permease protein